MNGKERIRILKDNGYSWYEDIEYVWYFMGMGVGQDEDFKIATEQAWRHWLNSELAMLDERETKRAAKAEINSGN